MISQTLGTCIVILDPGRKNILLGKRLDKLFSGLYGMPGGRMEKGEGVFECGIRELLEETGLRVDSLGYLGVVREYKGDYSFIHFALCCDNFLGVPGVSEPELCESWQWFSLDSLPENIIPGHKAAIDIYLNPEPSLRDI